MPEKLPKKLPQNQTEFIEPTSRIRRIGVCVRGAARLPARCLLALSQCQCSATAAFTMRRRRMRRHKKAMHEIAVTAAAACARTGFIETAVRPPIDCQRNGAPKRGGAGPSDPNSESFLFSYVIPSRTDAPLAGLK